MAKNDFIKLRERKLANGNKSLYLDIYRDGKRVREFLKLYIIPEHSNEDKKKNAITRALAAKIQGERGMQLLKVDFDVSKIKKASSTSSVRIKDVVEYRYERDKTLSKNSRNTYRAVANKLSDTAPNPKLSEIKETYLIELTEWFVNNGSKTSSALLYASVTSAAIKYYAKTNKLPSIYLAPTKMRAPASKGRFFFREDEIQKLEELLHNEDEIRRLGMHVGSTVRNLKVLLFTVYSGIRKSDVIKLRYEDIAEGADGIVWLHCFQQKTKGSVNIPLMKKALDLIDYSPDKRGLVFDVGAPQLDYGMITLTRKTGIKITMHKGRHTYAMMLLKGGADILTVSKLLGHATLDATQFYVDALDEEKVKAVRNLANLLDGK